ncbi:MAG: ferrous iron transporter B, partial [Bacteroidales bacterium]|nr:ferrous iron transporter B [Bacteroidales bacterium]
GYMARATFILDKLMHSVGLHGRSFIPLLTGFGCSVPAIMACRTLENKKDRILTMLLIPFMSCSAKLPVYLLIVSAFFKQYQGLILLGIYLFGVIIAVLVSLILKKTLFKKESEQFVMELPPYRMATLRNTLLHMWNKTVQYLQKIGTVILVASVIIWALNYFPISNDQTKAYQSEIIACQTDTIISNTEKTAIVDSLQIAINAAQQEGSYIGTIGKIIEPVLRPLGFDWRMSVCVLTGLAAKETIVSSMSVLYKSPQSSGTPNEDTALQESIRQAKNSDGTFVFTPLTAISFLVFVLLYAPCVATIAACSKESSRKWALFMFFYTTAVAWIASFVIFQIGSLLM